MLPDDGVTDRSAFFEVQPVFASDATSEDELGTVGCNLSHVQVLGEKRMRTCASAGSGDVYPRPLFKLVVFDRLDEDLDVIVVKTDVVSSYC